MLKYQVHIPNEIKPLPAEYEVSAAMIIADYFQSDVTFVKRSQNHKTADFKINGKIWELKSPVGNSKRTMQNNLRKADHQSANIIIDLRRCKMHSAQAISRIKYEIAHANNIQRLIIIQKNENVLVLK